MDDGCRWAAGWHGGRSIMRIFIYGETGKFASGAWCYAETLRDMGHEVSTFQDSWGLEHYSRSLLWRAIRKLNRGPLGQHRKRHVDAFIHEVQAVKPEIVIVLKGMQLGRADVRRVKDSAAWVVNLNHDDFFSVNRNNWTWLQHEALPAYDHVFTTRTVNVDEIRPLNRSVSFLEFAYYPKIHHPEPIASDEAARWNVDVVFVGTWERPRALTLERLVLRVPSRYAIYGTQWHKLSRSSPLRRFVRGGEIVGDAFNKALGGAKIALGFLRKQNRDDYTQRTFEIPACGGFLLGERTARHLSYYREGEEAVFFDPDDPDELVRAVQGLLRNDTRREGIRQAGMRRLARGNHTYADRMTTLLELHAEAMGKSVA